MRTPAHAIVTAAKDAQHRAVAGWKADAQYAETAEEFQTCTRAHEKIASVSFVTKSARRIFACGEPMYAAQLLDSAAAEFELGEDAMVATVPNGAVLTW